MQSKRGGNNNLSADLRRCKHGGARRSESYDFYAQVGPSSCAEDVANCYVPQRTDAFCAKDTVMLPTAIADGTRIAPASTLLCDKSVDNGSTIIYLPNRKDFPC